MLRHVLALMQMFRWDSAAAHSLGFRPPSSSPRLLCAVAAWPGKKEPPRVGGSGLVAYGAAALPSGAALPLYWKNSRSSQKSQMWADSE